MDGDALGLLGGALIGNAAVTGSKNPVYFDPTWAIWVGELLDLDTVVTVEIGQDLSLSLLNPKDGNNVPALCNGELYIDSADAKKCTPVSLSVVPLGC